MQSGVKFVLVRYGNFYQLIMPWHEGHASICIEAQADPSMLVGPIQSALHQSGLQ
jgi:hypothetical protein